MTLFCIKQLQIIINNAIKMRGKFMYKKKLVNYNSSLMKKNEISKLINEKINNFHHGKVALTFEENIRQLLQFEFNWRQSRIPRDFFYREIKLKGSQNSTLLMKNNSVSLKTKNGLVFNITFNDNDKSCQIINEYTNRQFDKLKDAPVELEKDICGKTLVAFPSKRIEVDGLFEVENFSFPYFNGNEASVIYKNFDNKDVQKFAYIIVEVKLSSNRLSDLIKQIHYDNFIMSKILDHQIIFFGFCIKGETTVDVKLNDMNIDLKFALIEINTDFLCGRKMTQIIDWALVKEVKNLKKDVEDLKGDMKMVKDEIRRMSNILNSLVSEKKGKDDENIKKQKNKKEKKNK